MMVCSPSIILPHLEITGSRYYTRDLALLTLGQPLSGIERCQLQQSNIAIEEAQRITQFYPAQARRSTTSAAISGMDF